MALTATEIKQDLATLKEKRAELDRKIQGLEHYLGLHKTSTIKVAGINAVSARGGVDIRPTVKAIYAENGNQAIRVKDLVDMIVGKHPEMDKTIVGRKMVHVKRTILKQEGYGMYRLKEVV